MDFKNLNVSSLKDNYLLPNMEAMLQKVTRCELLSMMDGFSGYNQVMVKEYEQYKTPFTTLWGTYVYVRIPFGPIIASATFQRFMDVAFDDFIDLFEAIYQDDLTVHRKKEEDHCSHLEKIVVRALEYKISLNPKKCVFGVKEGKLLGHIVSKEWVRIDPEHVATIDKIPQLKNAKWIQSYFGKINFVRRYFTNFVEIVRPISKILKRGEKIVWIEETSKAYQDIKQDIKEVIVLKYPNYAKTFQLFTFSLFHILA